MSMSGDTLNLIGRTLDGYKVLRLLGAGGMGAVYEAHHEVLDRSVAIKVIRPELANTERLVKRFLREAKALAKLSHPSTTTIYSFGQSEGVLYMALELVSGVTIAAELARGGPFAVDRAVGLTIQVLGALEAAHALKIIHRDLKPENIMVVQGAGGVERVKLLDFGLAKIIEGSNSPSGLTAPGAAVGTLAYMAPEQVDNALMTDERSDLYAMGVVLYEMLSGDCPYYGVTTRQIIMKKLAGPPPAVRLLRPDVAVSIEQILSRVLLRDPVGRFQDARSFAEALAAARHDKPPASDARPAIGRTTIRRRHLLQSRHAVPVVGAGAETVEQPKPAPGTLVGRELATYRLEQLLATARTGEVYEALDLAFDRIVAVKVVPDQGGALERLRREAMLLARIGAPATFDIVETATQDGLAFLVLLGVAGRPLSDVARETRRFPVERAVACAVSLLATLAEVHAFGLVHRDVEPRNVLVSVNEQGETFRLLDFALASDPSLAGMPPPPHASPEQQAGAVLDARSDLYSVAALLKGLVAGPGEPAPPLLAPVLDRALAARPQDRYPDARAFAAALEAAAFAPRIEPAPAGTPKDEGSLLGRRIGRYRVDELLGTGSLGDVYRATQLDLRRPVAIRVLAADLAADKELVKVMVRAARPVARLVHPGIAHVHEVVISGPRFVAMELVAGRRLVDLLREGPLPIERATAYALRILGAVSEAHGQGVVHGGLDAGSIVLAAGKAEQPKIVDFGVAAVRALAARKPGHEERYDASRACQPPERVSGEGPSESGDVFAVGCILFEMLTAKPVDLLARSPRKHRAEIPDALDALVLRAIALRPDERFENARAFGAALRALS